MAIPLGFITTALPTASAGAAFHTGIAIGKFHGVINPATPYGSRTANKYPGVVGGITVPIGSIAACAL